MTDRDRYERIREALAMRHTPGPRRVLKIISFDGSDKSFCYVATADGKIICDLRDRPLGDAHLIAACDPDTIRALLDERDAQQPAEQHPDDDDAAVDRFAAAMKAKLKKKRLAGRAGWQFMTSEQLSALLHEHVRKGDPVDVANLAMMLHQNGQVIEPPAAVVTDEMVEILQAEVERLEKAMHALEQHDEALLRQALKALESGAWDTLRGRNAAAAIRERLGEKVRSSKQ